MRFSKYVPETIFSAFMTSSVLFENERSPIIGLSGFVLTSMQGAKFRLIPNSDNSSAISFVCFFKNSLPFSNANLADKYFLPLCIFSVLSTRPPSWSIDKKSGCEAFFFISAINFLNCLSTQYHR